MKVSRATDGQRTLAVFLDFENIGIGLRNRRDSFQISKVLERLVEKGKIVAKKSYADWTRYADYTRMLHDAAFELIGIPKRSATGKNSADIRLVVDAIDLAYSRENIDTFVIVSGDSDFSPLVSKLKELGKHVIGIGLAEATSELLRDNCDEFLYYDDLDRPTLAANFIQQLPEDKKKVFGLLLESLLALRRENKEILWSSMVKDTMKRKKPSFNEEYHGYRTFTQLLEDAQTQGFIELEKHKTSGSYVVTRFGEELKHERPVTPMTFGLEEVTIQRVANPGEAPSRGRGPAVEPKGLAQPPRLNDPRLSPAPVEAEKVIDAPPPPTRTSPPRRNTRTEKKPVIVDEIAENIEDRYSGEDDFGAGIL